MISYLPKENKVNTELESEIIFIHRKSINHYGTRKIRNKFAKKGYQLSRRRIGKIMKKYNEDKIANVVNRDFDKEESLDVVVGDLTYVNFNGNWNYICLIIDFFNLEFIGYAAGKKKNAELVTEAFKSIKRPLDQINILHTDRGNEFKNNAVDDVLGNFILRVL